MRQAVTHLKRADPIMRGIIERVGPYRIAYREPGFEALVRSIVYQQLSGKAAATILARVIAAMPGGRVTPDAVLRARTPRLRALGLSSQKAAYLKDLARRTESAQINFAGLAALSDDEVIARLTVVKGIGVWTAQMFLIFALRRPNILPTRDLGIRTAIRRAYALGELPTPRQIEALAAPWCPYCSVASWYLWRSVDGPAQV